jgi:hypothetical protein
MVKDVTRIRRESVLLAYARADESWAQWLTAELGAEYFQLVDSSAIGGSAFRSVAALWLLYSSASAGASWLADDVTSARRARKPIRLIRLDDSPLPHLPSGTRRSDLRRGGPTRQSVSRLTTSLRRDAGGEASPSPRHRRPPEGAALGGIGETAGEPEPVLEVAPERHFPIPPVPPAPLVRRAAVREMLAMGLGTDGRSQPILLNLFGPASSGKSTVAAMVVDDCHQEFSDVAWSSGGRVRAALLELTRALDASDTRRADQRMLLVADDIDASAAASLASDAPTMIDILAISKTPIENRGGRERRLEFVQVTPLIDEDEARAFVRSVLPDAASEQVERIVSATGRDIVLLATVRSSQRSWSSGEADGVVKVSNATLRAMDGEYLLDTNNPRVIADWERAFVRLSTGSEISLGTFRRGSWFRKWSRSPGARQAAAGAARAVEVAALVGPESEANRNNAEAIARLIEASAEVPNLVVCSGSIVLVKFMDDNGTPCVVSETLTPTQLRAFKADGARLQEPSKALTFLAGLREDPPAQLESGAPS